MSYPLFATCDDRGCVAENLGQTLHHFGGVILDPVEKMRNPRPERKPIQLGVPYRAQKLLED